MATLYFRYAAGLVISCRLARRHKGCKCKDAQQTGEQTAGAGMVNESGRKSAAANQRVNPIVMRPFIASYRPHCVQSMGLYTRSSDRKRTNQHQNHIAHNSSLP